MGTLLQDIRYGLRTSGQTTLGGSQSILVPGRSRPSLDRASAVRILSEFRSILPGATSMRQTITADYGSTRSIPRLAL